MSRGYRGAQSTLTQVASHWNKCCKEGEAKLWTFTSRTLFFLSPCFSISVIDCDLTPCFCQSNPVLQAYVNLHSNADVATCTLQYMYKPPTLRVEIDVIRFRNACSKCLLHSVMDRDIEMSSFSFAAVLSATRHEIYRENEGWLPIQSGSRAPFIICFHVSILN